MQRFPVAPMPHETLDSKLADRYRHYAEMRARFLLDRYSKYPRFPGVHTGFDSISGEEFPAEELFTYSWINARGAFVLSRFAMAFPDLRERSLEYAAHVVEALESHWKKNNEHFPFKMTLSGEEVDVGGTCPPGYRSNSDLYAVMGFMEYGAVSNDAKRLDFARGLFRSCIESLHAQRVVTEPEPIPEDRVLENPYAIAVDICNEFYKHTDDVEYLDEAAKLIELLLERYYLPNLDMYIEYVTSQGTPVGNADGMLIVDPGHAIEFFCFTIEFARLAESAGLHNDLVRRIREVAPHMVARNVEKGWNKRHGGIYKTIDPESGQALNTTMPWWICPETLLAIALAFEHTKEKSLLTTYKQVHDHYVTKYLNPVTDFGPIQNLSGETGEPVRIPPAVRFQDPEFHSARNILSVASVIDRLVGTRHA